MSPFKADPLDARVLERNYDYAQKDIQLLAMWYDCDTEALSSLAPPLAVVC